MSRVATVLYNIGLEQRRDWWLRYHGTKPGIGYTYQNAQLLDLKEGFPEFNCLYSLVAQEVLRALHKDYRSFFARLKQQRQEGKDVTARLPWFKSSRYFFTLTYIQSGFGVKDGKLVLSGGMEEYMDEKGRTKRRRRRETIKIAGCRNLPEKVHSLTIRHRDGRFYANLTYEVEPRLPEGIRPLKGIAFDPGVKTFLTGADDSGRLIEFQSLIKRSTKYFDGEIDRVKSLRDKCQKGSRRYRRLKQVLHVLHQRRNAQVDDELHSIAKVLASGEWDVVGIGNPGKQGMVSEDPEKGRGNQNINRAVQNNWPLKKLLGYVDYKLEYRGGRFVPVDERYSTQECNHCGHRMKIDPSVRVYRCPECGMELGRDENAAINLLNRVLTGMNRQKKDYRAIRVRIAFHRTLSGRWEHRDVLTNPA
ncbi:MAG TPA: transposase [Spirochaetia bacterium]|nr:transposase [Spirochaetia bacterium]